MSVAFGQAINANTPGVRVGTLTSPNITTANGQLVFVGIQMSAATPVGIATIIDSYGNTMIAGPTLNPGIMYSYYCPNIVGGSGYNVTVTTAGGSAYYSFIIGTFTGCATSSALDQSTTWGNSGFYTDHPHTALNFTGTSTVTTGAAGEAVVAFNCSQQATAADTFTAGSGWTIPTNGQNPGNGSTYSPNMLQYQVNVAAGTYQDTYTTGNFVNGQGIIMTFKALPASGSNAGLMLATMGVG
jgi:hypothetical protein